MKIIMIISMMILFIDSLAQARRVVMAETNFISLPIFESYSTRVSGFPSEMGSECSKFKNLIEAYKGDEFQLVKERFKDFRTLVAPWQSGFDSAFQLELKIESVSFNNLLLNENVSELKSRLEYEAKKEQLPLQILKADSVQIQNLAGNSVELKSSSDSITAYGGSLEVNPSNARIKRVGSGYVMQIDGMDLACDFYEHKVELKTSVQVNVRPSILDQDRIGTLYFDISNMILEILQLKGSLRSKAAKIGYSLGEIFDAYKLKDHQSIYIENLMDKLFIEDTLNFSSFWIEGFEKKKAINLEKMAQLKINLYFESQ